MFRGVAARAASAAFQAECVQDVSKREARKAQQPITGRGAASYVPGRHAVTAAQAIDDGWGDCRQPPKAGHNGPPSHSQRAIHADTSAAITVNGNPKRTKSPNRYCPGPRISRLP